MAAALERAGSRTRNSTARPSAEESYKQCWLADAFEAQLKRSMKYESQQTSLQPVQRGGIAQELKLPFRW